MTTWREVDRTCWCGSRKATPIMVATVPLGKFRYVRCNGCGVVAMDPQPDDATLGRAYDPSYYGASREKFAGPVARLVALFQGGRARLARRFVREGGRFLDVGCGNGGFLRQMQMAGYQVEGTEYSADGAARVPAEWKIPVHVGDLTTLSLEPGTYDGVCLWHVFEHVRKPAETVERARTLLRTGGIFLLAMPNQESLQAERFGKNWFHLDPPRHLFGFGPKSLTALLEKEGFTVEETGTLSWEQNPYGWAQSLLNRWGFPRERAYETLKRTGTHGLSARLLDVVLLAMLVPYAIILSAVEAARGRGGTLILVARKKSA